MEDDLIVIESAAGMLEAEILRALLESYDIRTLLSQESAASAIGLSIGPLGRVDILVPASQVTEARKILSDYQDRLAAEEEG